MTEYIIVDDGASVIVTTERQHRRWLASGVAADWNMTVSQAYAETATSLDSADTSGIRSAVANPEYASASALRAARAELRRRGDE
jgi:hypothetical protein